MKILLVRPIDDVGNGHCIRMLPLIARECRDVLKKKKIICDIFMSICVYDHLPDESRYNSLVVEDLEWEHRVASLEENFA